MPAALRDRGRTEKSRLTRRSFLTIVTAGATALLAGCASDSEPEPQVEDEPTVADEPAADAEGSADPGTTPTGATLVAYFSATGNTEGVATAIAERLGADVFAIEAAEPYTEEDLDYNDDGSRTSVERANGTDPELAQVTPDSWAGYDTVPLGYPIWWGEAASPLRTFVAGNDFAGKTVVPFCTSGSSGIGGSADALAELAGSGNWLEGERFPAGAGDEAAKRAAGLEL